MDIHRRWSDNYDFIFFNAKDILKSRLSVSLYVSERPRLFFGSCLNACVRSSIRACMRACICVCVWSSVPTTLIFMRPFVLVCACMCVSVRACVHAWKPETKTKPD